MVEGEDGDNQINRREGFVIYELQTLTLSGLNNDFELKSFLKE